MDAENVSELRRGSLGSVKTNFCARRSSADFCTFKEHPSCGVLSYKLKESEFCPPRDYKWGKGPVCGVELYKLGRSAACGVVKYKEKQDLLCGVHKDYLEQGYDPGFRNCWVGRENVSPVASTDKGLWDKFFPAADWDCPRDSRYIAGQSICQNKHSGHWYIICKGDVANTCRRSEFGIEEYQQCRAPGHGVETYLPCRDKSFGVETYLSCRHEAHGVDKYNSCYSPIDLAGPTSPTGPENENNRAPIKCSQDPRDYR